MLSAFAARSQAPTPVVETPGALSGANSEIEEQLASVQIPLKRKSIPVEESSSTRKRKKSSQKPKATQRVEVNTNGYQPGVLSTPVREYSPSVPVASAQDAVMLDIEPSNEKPVISTFTPLLNQNAFFDGSQASDTILYLIFNPLETLSFVGTISLTVIQGELSLFGSLLQASTIQHSVFAPKNYPTATIKALEHSGNNKTLPETIAKSVNPSQTVIMVKDLHSGIQGLGRVCGILQPAFETVNEFSFDLRLREFHPILHGSTSHSPFQIPPSWEEALGDLNSRVEYPTMLIQGPKNSGKSMFGRLLVNHLLLRYKQVAYLDCDIGQTELTPPGLVSLHILSEPILGPPFTHPHEPLRAQFVGSTSMRSNSSQLYDCIAALLDTYRVSVKYGYVRGNASDEDQQLTFESAESDSVAVVPLVINTFGWTKGLGTNSIRTIEEQAEVTHVFTFESAIQDGAWQAEVIEQIPGVHYVPLQSIEPSGFDINAFDKRALMTMSYFHHQGGRWKTDIPLCALPPWEVTWANALDRFVLIGSGSEDVHRSEVLRVLNGAVVALVSVDQTIPGWSESGSALGNPPYIQGSSAPSPVFSHCIGYALVRSVRASTGTLQILTPVSPDRLSQARVLVMGEIKLPIWGMLDHRAESKSLGQIAGVDYASVPFLQWPSGLQDTPGSKRLRIRRNLMRKGQL